MGRLRLILLAAIPVILTAAPLPAVASVNSLRVNGNMDRVVIPNAPALNPGGAITIEAWVKQTTNAQCQTIVGKNYLTGYWLGLCSGRIRYYHRGGTGFGGDGVTVAPIGEWTHIAVTYDGSFKHFYMNGVLDRTIAVGDPLPVNLDSIGIGGEATDTCGNTCPFLGDISEVRIWDIARSQTGIRRDIVKQIETAREGLVAVWHLEGGPQEAFGNYDGTPDGAAAFFGSAAPPVSEDPLLIPRLSGGPTLDGQCNATNGPLRIPVWDDGPFQNVEWLYLGATSTNLYVCIENMPRAGGFAAVYADPDNDAGLYADPDDFRLRLPEGGTMISEAGTGSGGYAGPGPATSNGLQYVGNEFVWSAEFRISRGSLEQAPDKIFGLQVIDDQDGGASRSADWGWPVDYFWDWPDRYESVAINNSPLSPSDYQNPTADAWHEPGIATPGPVVLNVLGIDNNGIASITIYLDFAAVFSCTFSEIDPTRGCSVELPLDAGLHHLYGEVTDFAGRTAFSNVDSFRVVLDDRAPEFLINLDPFEAPLGGSTEMTVSATDASGIEFIDIDSFRCTFSGANTEESCSSEISAAAGHRVRAVIVRAIDSEGLETVATRRVLFGNDGPDGDGDGLSDDIEASLCTSPFRADTDSDSLSDKWEVLGLYFPVSGDYVDLPGLGANPCHKDAFLQYDYEVGARVEAGVIESIVQAYSRNGVTLHVTENERPRPAGDPVSPFGGVEGGIRIDDSGEYYFPPKLNWTHVYAYGRHAKGSSGHYEGYFNHDIYAGGTEDCACPLTGVDPADCGTSRESTPTNCIREGADGQTRRFMHELGHMLGLGHGGRKNAAVIPTLIGDYLYYEGERDDENHKPNYRSVMNYVYNGNVCLRPGTGFFGDLLASYDYSSDLLPTLNESNLDERSTGPMATLMADIACPMAVAGAEPIIFHTCADPDEDDSLDLDLDARRSLMVSNGAQHKWRYMHGGTWQNSGWNVPAAEGIDWNCDGIIESSVNGNLNGNQGGNVRPLPPDNEICGDGMDTNGDGRGDGADCNWNVSGSGNLLLPNRDWNDFPRAEPCVIPYRGSLLCYFQPADYRARIEIDDGRLDCRPMFFPDVDCPIPPGGRASAGGLADEYEIEDNFFELPPNTEVCDGLDNDGDREIDEGCRDTDADGLADDTDNCPTVANAGQADTDGDSLGDACDGLSMGPLTFSVQGNGVVLQIDWNGIPGTIGYNVYRSTGTGEFVYQSLVPDEYPSTVSAVFLDTLPDQPLNWRYRIYPVDAHGAEGEPAEGGYSTDDDLDSVGNDIDNCLLIANPGQQDSDGDGHGNRCDGDFDQSCGLVNFSDLSLMADAFFTPDALFDLDSSDGVVNFADLGILGELLFLPPGPSAPGALCDPQ